MKFVCENCGTQYLISDEKVGAKGAKIRCKKCGNIILLRPGGQKPEEESKSSVADSAPIAEGPTGASEAEGDQDELGQAFDQLLKGGLDPGDEGEEEEQRATEIFSMEEIQRLRDKRDGAQEDQDKIDEVFSKAESTDVRSLRDRKEEEREEWYVAIADEQVGPLGLAEIERRWEAGEIGPESLGWHPGMGDWLPVRDIPKLRYLLGAMESKAKAAPAEAPPAEESWVATGSSSLSSLVEEELQAVKSKPEPEPKKQKPVEEEAIVPPADDGEVPPWEQAAEAEASPKAETKQPDSYFDSSQDQPAADSGADSTGKTGRQMARPAYLSERKKGSATKVVLLVFALVVVVGGAAVAVTLVLQKEKTEGNKSGISTPIEAPRSSDAGTGASEPVAQKEPKTTGDDPGNEGNPSEGKAEDGAVKDSTKGEPTLVAGKNVSEQEDPVSRNKPDKTAPPKDRTKVEPRKKPTKTVAVDKTRNPELPPTPVKQDQPPPDVSEQAPETKPDKPGALPETLDKAEISATMRKYVNAMKGCVKQQQQRDPTVTGTMLVSFTIQPSGKVDEVKILSTEHSGTYVAGCITFIIKSMKFGKFTGEPIPVPKVPLRLGG